MTTIAYKDGVIAADGRVTRGDSITTDSDVKFYRHLEVLFAHTGDCASRDRLIDLYFSPDKVTESEGIAGSLVAVDKDNNVFGLIVNDGEVSKFPYYDGDAEGSGAPYAIAAMRCGKSAVEAVAIAAGCDCKTGGQIRSYEIATGKWGLRNV